MYSLIAVLSWPILPLLFRSRVRGTEHLAADGGYVLAGGLGPKLDPWPLGLRLWPRRCLRFMAKSELFWLPLSLVVSGAGAFRVNRGRSDREALETAVNLAREGNVIAMFPEGTRRKK